MPFTSENLKKPWDQDQQKWAWYMWNFSLQINQAVNDGSSTWDQQNPEKGAPVC
jgi:hypothetical protein